MCVAHDDHVVEPAPCKGTNYTFICPMRYGNPHPVGIYLQNFIVDTKGFIKTLPLAIVVAEHTLERSFKIFEFVCNKGCNVVARMND